jgi:hypothetical protein
MLFTKLLIKPPKIPDEYPLLQNLVETTVSMWNALFLLAFILRLKEELRGQEQATQSTKGSAE